VAKPKPSWVYWCVLGVVALFVALVLVERLV